MQPEVTRLHQIIISCNQLQSSCNCVVEVLATHSTTYCNYVFEKKLHQIQPSLQPVLNTLQPSCNCVVEVLTTHSTTYCNYVFEKKNFIKYSLHGSRCVKHIFFNNLLQTDLKSDLWFRRYRIFFLWNQQKFPCMHASWSGGLSCQVASRSWLSPFSFCMQERGLTSRSPVAVLRASRAHGRVHLLHRIHPGAFQPRPIYIYININRRTVLQLAAE